MRNNHVVYKFPVIKVAKMFTKNGDSGVRVSPAGSESRKSNYL